MPSKTHHLLTILSAALCMAASAQNCALPPGTVGIGKYCTRDSVAIPIAQMTPNTKPSAPANATPEPSAKVSAVPGSPAAVASSTPAATPTPAPAVIPAPAAASVLTDVAAPPVVQGGGAVVSGLRVRTSDPAVRVWSILPTDGRLATTFARWAHAEGMKLVWDAQQHVMLSSADSFTGTLTEALNRVLTSPAIRLSPYPLEACIYPNNPPLLRITRAGEQSLECPQ